MKSTNLVLKKDKEFQLFQGHPWVYREAIKEIPVTLQTGDEVAVLSHRGKWIGRGFADLDSPIVVRIIGFDEKIDLNVAIKTNLESAIALRRRFFVETVTNGYRLINGEGDSLGGLILDRFGEVLSLQVYSLGWEPYLKTVMSVIQHQLPEIRWVWRRNQVRRAEKEVDELAMGRDFPGKVVFRENGLKFRVDVKGGQKTGFFLDQRDNRKMIRGLAKGRRVANICGYTGAFSVYALAGGAKEVVTVDTAKPALEEAEGNIALNGFQGPGHKVVCQDMFEYLEQAEKKSFGLVILDPPSMARAKRDAEKAVRAYRRLNTLGMGLLESGGMLYTASCSSHVGRDEFLDIVSKSAADAGCRVRLLAETHHSVDHPILLGHPEGRYLHGLLCELTLVR